MIDTGQYLSSADREQLRLRRIRREEDPMIIRLRRNIRLLRALPEEEYSEYHRQQVKTLKRRLLRKIKQY